MRGDRSLCNGTQLYREPPSVDTLAQSPRLFALWVEGPARRSADLSFPGVAGMARPLSSHWRVEPGTRTAPILGHRVVRVRWYPARFLKFCRRHGGEPHLPATGRTLRSGVGLDPGASGVAACRPPQPRPGQPSFRRLTESLGHPLNSSSVPMALKSSAVWAGWSSRSPIGHMAWC